MTRKTKEKEKISLANKIIISVSILIGLFLIIIIALNLTLYIQGIISPEKPPSLKGITPLVVASDSMENIDGKGIRSGDLIFVNNIKDINDLSKGDIILYKKDDSTILHRITDVEIAENGELLFYTKGDANNKVDTLAVRQEEIIGSYVGGIPKLGEIVLFMKTPLGILLGIGIPLALALTFIAIWQHKKTKAQEEEIQELEQKLSQSQTQ